MDCEQAQANIIAFIDDELEGQLYHEVQEHISSCVECSSAQECHLSTLSLADSWIVTEIDLVTDVMKQIRAVDFEHLLQEVAMLKKEVGVLRAEVKSLKEKAFMSSPVLMPYQPIKSLNLRLM